MEIDITVTLTVDIDPRTNEGVARELVSSASDGEGRYVGGTTDGGLVIEDLGFTFYLAPGAIWKALDKSAWRDRVCSGDHTRHYGELWQCAACKHWFCYAEGTDNDPGICDSCWSKEHGENSG